MCYIVPPEVRVALKHQQDSNRPRMFGKYQYGHPNKGRYHLPHPVLKVIEDVKTAERTLKRNIGQFILREFRQPRIHMRGDYLRQQHTVCPFFSTPHEWHFDPWSLVLSQSCTTVSLIGTFPYQRADARVSISPVLRIIHAAPLASQGNLPEPLSIQPFTDFLQIHHHTKQCIRRQCRTDRVRKAQGVSHQKTDFKKEEGRIRKYPMKVEIGATDNWMTLKTTPTLFRHVLTTLTNVSTEIQVRASLAFDIKAVKKRNMQTIPTELTDIVEWGKLIPIYGDLASTKRPRSGIGMNSTRRIHPKSTWKDQ